MARGVRLVCRLAVKEWTGTSLMRILAMCLPRSQSTESLPAEQTQGGCPPTGNFRLVVGEKQTSIKEIEEAGRGGSNL